MNTKKIIQLYYNGCGSEKYVESLDRKAFSRIVDFLLKILLNNKSVYFFIRL